MPFNQKKRYSICPINRIGFSRNAENLRLLFVLVESKAIHDEITRLTPGLHLNLLLTKTVPITKYPQLIHKKRLSSKQVFLPVFILNLNKNKHANAYLSLLIDSNRQAYQMSPSEFSFRP